MTAIGDVQVLYRAIAGGGNATIGARFDQWRIVFREVCGYELDSSSDNLRKLAEFCRLPENEAQPAALLFAVQTYQAWFTKLLAAHVAAFVRRLPSPAPKMMDAAGGDLLRAVEELESGDFFSGLNFPNFLADDYFGWCAAAWSPPIENVIRVLAARASGVVPGDLLRNPDAGRKLLRMHYAELFPETGPGSLGEPATPDWLAEHILNEAGLVGDADERLLDPACGSGTILVAAIRRVRQSREDNQLQFDSDDAALCRQILANVVGIDLDPLAVATARANYLFALGDLLRGVDRAEIPVHHADAILTPANVVAGRFDCVAVNPPGQRWDSLPAEYRHRLTPLWQKYGPSATPDAASPASANKEISRLFVYCCIDNYLKNGGRLSAAVADAFLKTAGKADGFRLGESGDFFKVDCVHDWSRLRFADGFSGPTAVFTATKGRRTTYPFPYVVWKPPPRPDRSAPRSFAEAPAGVEFARRRARSPIAAAPPASGATMASVKKLLGACAYKAAGAADAGAPFHVVWRLSGEELQADVSSQSELGAPDAASRPPKTRADAATHIACQTREEALYLAGLLNSTPCRAAAYSFLAPGQPFAGAELLKNLRIARFERHHGVHKVIVHIAGFMDKLRARSIPPFAQIENIQDQLDRNVLKYWSLTADDLAALKAAADERESVSVAAISGE
jgi:hypothetical protein